MPRPFATPLLKHRPLECRQQTHPSQFPQGNKCSRTAARLKLEEDPDAGRENQQPRKEGMASLIPRFLTTVVARMATGQGEVWDSQLPGLSLPPQRSEKQSPFPGMCSKSR